VKPLLALALVAGCIGGADETYRDPKGAFTVRYPAGWKVEMDRGSVVFSGEQDDVTVAVTSAPRKEAWRKEPRGLSGVSQAAAVMLTQLPHGKVLSQKPVTVGGLSGVVLDVGFEHDGKPYRRKQWVLEGPSRMGYLGYTAPTAKWDRGEAIADVMVQTLVLQGGGS
jgi:hypothetical protein